MPIFHCVSILFQLDVVESPGAPCELSSLPLFVV